MGTIENTLGIVGRGRAIDNLFRAIAEESNVEGAIPLKGIDEIVFFNHTEGDNKETNDEFLQKVLGKKPCGKTGPTLGDISNAKGINISVNPEFGERHINFRKWYTDSSALFFAPGLNLFYEPFQEITDAIIDDFISAEEKIKGTNEYLKYKRKENETYNQMLKSRLKKYDILYEIMVDVFKSCTIEEQQKFFIKAYEHGHFKKIEDANKTEKTEKSKDENDLEKKITVEALSIIFGMKREGRLPYGYRIWGCFAPSLKMLIDYAKLFRLTLHEPKDNPKPILVLTNEMSMACNILAMFNPRLTPFLAGVSDYDVERARELFADHLKSKLNLKELDIGVIGDHESYALPVFPKGFLEQYDINPEDAYTHFRNLLYSYVSDKSGNGEDPNTTVRNSLIKVINAAIKSLETGLRFEGDFYDGVFMPFDYGNSSLVRIPLVRKGADGNGYIVFAQENERYANYDGHGKLNFKEHSGIFATSHHSFCNGRIIPLGCEASNVKDQFLNCLADYATLLYRLITNDVIGKELVDPVRKERICCVPYVENGEQQDRNKRNHDNEEYLISLGRRVVRSINQGE